MKTTYQKLGRILQFYDPRAGRRIEILDPDGTIREHPNELKLMSHEETLEAYRTMVLARQADDWAVSLNRQGRLATYPPNRGQEANAVGALMALRADESSGKMRL
jgi:pyruvate dehydrogenase E1 component alpha subunit